MSQIPVLCDRCRTTGTAGEGDFSHLGDLLEFTAVPRQLKRRNGWTPVLQREFIARLAQTGSPTLAVEEPAWLSIKPVTEALSRRTYMGW